MSSGPETRFITSIHRLLPPEDQLHREKMANPYRGGTADCWYSGNTDLWIEWKFITLPKRKDTYIDLGLSALQDDWLRGRWNEGRNVWVGVGCKEGGVLFRNGDWHLALIRYQFVERLQTKGSIANAIVDFCQN
jgi:hypothetical protein